MYSPFMTWEQKVDMLARYNSEAARGIMHTPEWKELMQELQRQFNQVQLRDIVEQVVEEDSKKPTVAKRWRWKV